LTVAGVADKSKPASTVVEGTCPGMGASWISLEPYAMKAPIQATAATVRAAHAKFVPGAEGNHLKQQWCSVSVAAKD